MFSLIHTTAETQCKPLPRIHFHMASEACQFKLSYLVSKNRLCQRADCRAEKDKEKCGSRHAVELQTLQNENLPLETGNYSGIRIIYSFFIYS